MSGLIERVVVTLDAASENRTAIDTAVALAVRTGAPLHGLFVEDDDLMRLAGLPFACQVTIGGGAERLSSETITLQSRAEAERARRELVGAAKQHRVACTFGIVGGANVLGVAGASERVLTVTGGLARPIAAHFRVEHRWRSSFEVVAGPLLLARGLWTAPGSVVILLRDRDASATRLFDIAAQIAAAKDSVLAVLCTPGLAGTAGVEPGIEQWVAERAAAHRVRVQFEELPENPTALRERLAQLNCHVIAFDAGLLEKGDSGLADLVERFSCDMLIVP